MSPENQAKAQYTFDVIAAHLLTQNAQSRKNGNSSICAYRGVDGQRCAVGFCIPDKNYNASLEGIGLAFVKDDERIERVTNAIADEYCNDVEFLCHMQVIHDAYTPDSWYTELGELALRYKLDSSIVDTFANLAIPQPEVLEYAN